MLTGLMLHFLQLRQHLPQVLSLCLNQLLNLWEIQSVIHRYIHIPSQLHHVWREYCVAIDCGLESHSHICQILILTSLLTLQETLQEIQDLLLVSLDLPNRTWPVWCGLGPHTIQQLRNVWKKFPSNFLSWSIWMTKAHQTKWYSSRKMHGQPIPHQVYRALVVWAMGWTDLPSSIHTVCHGCSPRLGREYPDAASLLSYQPGNTVKVHGDSP